MLEIRNLVFAVVLSVLIMMGWRLVYEKFFTVQHVVEDEDSSSMIPEIDNVLTYRSRNEIIDSTQNLRVKLSNKEINGSISLKGAQLDDLVFKNYHITPDSSSDGIILLSPENTEGVYFIEFGWIDPQHKIVVPNQLSTWTSDKSVLSPNNTVTLTWDNQQGVIFQIKVTLDDYYMFKIEQIIINNTDNVVNLIPYGRINRARHTTEKSYWISHEGAVGSFGYTLKEWTYKNIIKERNIKISQQNTDDNQWVGIADKYWFTALIPNILQKKSKLSFHVKHGKYNNEDRFQVDFSHDSYSAYPNKTASSTSYLFAGAKELKLLDKYKKDLNISLFDKAVDFGILYFITKPVFLLLEYFYDLIGNFGLAILLLTIVIKLIMFPLSYKSYISMFKLKYLQPEILKIKELYKNDNTKMSKEVSLLFKKNDVSPMSGFIPILIQIPVFFALYKVLFVTIEMRHAPFYLWVKDLSNFDTANVLTLFGLLNFNPPICIGILPVILGITMIIQQKMNTSTHSSQDQDKIQASFIKFLPYVFIFIFSSFPTGLIIYWICSNSITIIQQLIIKAYIGKKFNLKHDL
ncbi:membrane protein insertase YidC [Ehrlichia ruminantium]|uniref:membrane protein insertase YidC n=1 Tax=Ehrlichia ruminantium TaxID=779 RepID=UPI0015DCAE10|nr:membrane protein insertase YidC [Ehrlichia ruminantium]QLK50388.1 membrane protein insertase YidC [Ehrlichia ruminantium]QLK51312.1 membrane protein insertase YidC [Ehrlichia ruminantium]QLK53148.1 membrane protein insertase YidC [Ehrlichia ruminantium]